MPDTARTRTGLQASLGTDDLRTVDNTMRTAFDLLGLITYTEVSIETPCLKEYMYGGDDK